MATKKSMCVLFGILVISAWVLGSTVQAGAETMKGRNIQTATKRETIAVGDEEGHILGLTIMQGLAFIENGEIAKVKSQVAGDYIPQKGGQLIGYTTYTFEDGATIVLRFQRLMNPDGSATAKSEIVKGTGRFEGIKGRSSITGKNFPETKDGAARASTDFTMTYTLPTK